MQGVEAARDMIDAAQQNVQAGMAATQAQEAGIKSMKKWMNMWGVRG